MNRKQIITIIVAALLVIAASVDVVIYASGNDERKINKHLSIAHELMDKGEYEQAIVEFQKALRKSSTNFWKKMKDVSRKKKNKDNMQKLFKG